MERTLDTKQIARIQQMWIYGMTWKQIHAFIPASRGTIMSVVHGKGVYSDFPDAGLLREKVRMDMADRVRAMRAKGFTNGMIREVWPLSDDTIYNMVHRKERYSK